MSIPESQNIIIRWLQNPSLVPTQPLTPMERQAIMAAIDLLRIARSTNTPYLDPGAAVQDLQSRVTQLDRYIAQQLLPLITPPVDSSGKTPTPPQPDGRTPSGGPYGPIPQNNDVLLLLVNYLSQLLALPPSAKDRTHHERREDNRDVRVSRKHDAIPVPKGHKPPVNESHAPSKPNAKVMDSSGMLAQLTKRASQLLAGNGAEPKSIQGRTSPASKEENPAVPSSGKPTLNADEWVFRLMGIQAAAKHMAADGSEKPSAASSTQMAVAMSRLFTQFAKLQNLIGAQNHNPGSAADVLLQQVIGTAKNRIQAYLEHMTVLLQNPASLPLSPAQMENALQRSLQEEGWLSTLTAFVENRAGLAKSGSGLAPSIASEKGKETIPSQSQTQTKETAAIAKNPTFVPHDPLAVQLKHATDVALASAIKGESVHIAQQLLQPRSAPELLGMVQAHLAKHPLTPVNILIPYPMAMQLDDPISDVGAMEKQRNDAKRKSGQKAGNFGSANAQVMCLIPAGPVILGDPFKEGREDELPCQTEQLDAFLLAATPVTNAQFANWLNQQFEIGAIRMPSPGTVYDLDGHLLALTFEAAPLSQIELAVEHGDLYFRPIRYFENHPVVHVSWWGAKAFCETQGLILPSEAEWERGGGMLPTVRGQPIKKLRYGCSSQELTLAWANYHSHGKSPKENRTLPVGFFDGQRVLTIAGQRIETHRAVSPWGCFDMSGNVREWIADEYDEDGLFYITKGGSYADRPFDLRLSARLPMPRDSTDPYTGFRTAFHLQLQ